MSRIPALILVYCLAANAQPAQEAAPVKTAPLDELATYPERSAPAMVLSLNATTVSAEIAARVAEIPVLVGDVVETGGRLARLVCADYELARRQAEANLDSLASRIELAEKRLERTRTLERRETLARELLDERTTELAVLRAEKAAASAAVGAADLNVSRCDIKSPFRALVTARVSAVGQFASAGTPLIDILDLSAVEISAQVSPLEVPLVRAADSLYFTYADRRFPVTTRTILPAIDPDTRTQEVRLSFSRDSAPTGAAGKLIWRDPRPHVPAGLLVERGGRLGVFVHDDGTASFVPVPAARAGLSSPVVLPEDTQLITEGHYSLRDGAAVRPVE